ncbi:MAG: ribose-phosphate pyrophosphokinase [Alphaproteobacteria bacterium]|jgi:ribose-phosphate pyrophosphokinase|uniref:Ribose-phosphate pyrophosphokinase n=1 Tax=Novosphingobium soli TaxID=574956 RepID=A0ABV6CTK9_9SPHN|nr:ribose-phosphate pyrophosphokinase [Sphingobium sp.]MBS88218.1 phosphoribosylpyrophosphate synthetase [Sphingobium sp.]MBU0823231.1 ribose-phosphate pyrophosphokinase [Alphaproteobacteria bacterium]MBU0869022.1 ribose-phosphate pyrophosphokinase [Alphaproteobacteria bacterium]MBU1824623.1 ribose-phosphate pyrophosphokinase [Alphaproteobacteria bacterium]
MTMTLFPMPRNERLAGTIADRAGFSVGKLELRRFPDGESYVRLHSLVAGCAVAVVCTLARADEQFLQLLFTARLLRENGARSIQLVAPYLAYMRQDRRFQDGEALTSRQFAQLISCEFDGLITVDPHLHRYRALQEIYSIETESLAASPLLAEWVRDNVERPLIIGPDSESEQWAGAIATHIGAPHAVFTKLRRGDRDVLIAASDLTVWRERTPILVDDVISSGQTLAHAAREITAQGFPAPICLAVHGLFAPGAEELLKAIGCRIVTTDSIAHPSNAVALGPLLGQALVRQLTVVDAKRLRRTPK